MDANNLHTWLSQVRWWPKDSKVYTYELEYAEPYVFLWIASDKNARYFVPLRRASTADSQRYAERLLDIGGELFIEAELVEPFLVNARAFLECEYLCEDFVKSLTDAEKWYVKILADSSNVVTLGSFSGFQSVVMKSYRRVSAQNNEVEAFRFLVSEGFTRIPRVYMVCKRRGFYIGLALEYVEGVEGGKPFYDSMVKTFSSGQSYPVEDLGLKAGQTVAELHMALSKALIGIFDSSDVEIWSKRVEFIARELLKRLDELHSKGLVKGFWVETADKRAPVWIEEAWRGFAFIRGLRKIKCHQDLHLAQMVLSRGRGFIVTDFEGEAPLLSLNRVGDGHGFRDIASVIRSLDYIVFVAISNTLGLDPEETAYRLTRSGWGLGMVWRNIHANAILRGYIHGLGLAYKNVLGIESLSGIAKYLMPWYIYRALYEALYEALYRPHNISIPLHILTWSPDSALKGVGEAL